MICKRCEDKDELIDALTARCMTLSAALRKIRLEPDIWKAQNIAIATLWSDRIVGLLRAEAAPCSRCPKSDAWRCAVERSLTVMACDCACHKAEAAPYRCECGNTNPRHHHCGMSGYLAGEDAPCPGCHPAEAAPEETKRPTPAVLTPFPEKGAK
jgi:hypothetical protein